MMADGVIRFLEVRTKVVRAHTSRIALIRTHILPAGCPVYIDGKAICHRFVMNKM